MAMEEDTKREIDRLWERVNFIDDHGSRGVGSLQVQVTELMRDIGDLKTETITWQTKHEQSHATEATERASSKRWLIASVVIPTVAILITAAGVFEALLHLK